MKSGTENKLKFKKLQRRFGLALWQAAGLLETLWCCARTNTPAGDIGKLSNEEIAIEIDWRNDPDELVDALIECGWLDEDDEFRLVVHDWSEHVPNYLKGSFKSRNLLFADQVMARRPKTPPKGVSKTPPTKPTKPNQTKPTSLVRESFDRFWKSYPKKKSKGQAEKVWIRMSPSQELEDEIITHLEARSKADPQWLRDGGRYIPNPATWLNAKGWQDEWKEELNGQNNVGRAEPSRVRSADWTEFEQRCKARQAGLEGESIQDAFGTEDSPEHGTG